MRFLAVPERLPPGPQPGLGPDGVGVGGGLRGGVCVLNLNTRLFLIGSEGKLRKIRSVKSAARSGEMRGSAGKDGSGRGRGADNRYPGGGVCPRGCGGAAGRQQPRPQSHNKTR